MLFTGNVDTTQFGAFAEHRNLQPASYGFLQPLVIRLDLKQPTPKRNGHCMGPIIGLKFIHQVFDVEANRGL
jgi:hypothetical protein